MSKQIKFQRSKPGYLPLYVTGAVTLVAIITLTVVLCTSTSHTNGTPFVPPAFEDAAVEGTPSVPDHLGYGRLYRDGMGFAVQMCGNVTLDGRAATVYLTNPIENHVWIKLRVFDADGNLLGESGLLKPGEYVRSIELTQPLASGTPIKMKIMTYEPETYHSAGAITVNTAIGE